MEKLTDFFDRMHAVDFQYVVLRNWENLPNDVCLGEHSDLDILCYDFEHFREVFPMAVPEYPYPRVRMKIPIGDSFFYCDVRHLGDGYYPNDFARATLVSREYNLKGFYTPNPVHHRLALAYHVVHHKNNLSYNYMRYLGNVTVQELLDALKQSSIGWAEPSDKTVGRFSPYWKGATSVVEVVGDRVFKKQVSYSEYDLIRNEYEILKGLDSRHFPKSFSLKDGSLEIEHCGVPLMDDLPDDWEIQMCEIADDLEKFGIIHRDIRLDNLMVKDGVIKLIDFGWAKKIDLIEEKEPPSCLGIPNRQSSGWNDRFSIRSISKQIQYQIEEKNENIQRAS